MALIFKTPPNWPAQPEGWKPDNDWTPNPEWGPAPDGWQFWVEEGEEDQTVEANPHPAASSPAAPLARDLAEAEPVTSEQASTFQADAKPAASSPEPAPSPAPKPTPVATLASAEVSSLPSRAQARQEKKKNKKAGWLLGAGALIILLGCGAFALSQNSGEPEQTSTVADTSVTTQKTAEITASSSPTASELKLAAGTPKQQQGEYNAYSGFGEQVFDMIIPGGGGSYYTYDFTGESEGSKLKIQGMDERNFETGWGTEASGTKVSGSGVMDVSGDTRSFKVRANGEGEWTVSLFPIENAPVYVPGEVAAGSSSAAFYYEGPAKEAELVFIPASNSASLTLQAGIDQDKDAAPLVNTAKASSQSVKLGEGKTLLAVHATGGQWSLSFK